MARQAPAVYDLTAVSKPNALSNATARYIALGVGAVFGIGGLGLLALTWHSDPLRIAPFVAFLEIVAIAAIWAAARSTSAGPDVVAIDAEGIALSLKGQPLRKLRWTDPQFSLVLSDFSGDPRANAIATMNLFQMQLARGKDFWGLTPECYAAIVDAATSHGLSIQRESAARYHFPGGEIVTLGPATVRGASPA